MTLQRRRVCLFGLSADPPTEAHVGMVGTLCQHGDFDEIRIMPVYRHQFSVSVTSNECELHLYSVFILAGVKCVV